MIFPLYNYYDMPFDLSEIIRGAWSIGSGPKEYGLYLANKRKKYQPKQTNKKKNFKK